jgi:hypothetical protein
MQKTINAMTQVRGIRYLPRSLVTGECTPHSYPTDPRRNQTTYSPNLVEEEFPEIQPPSKAGVPDNSRCATM